MFSKGVNEPNGMVNARLTISNMKKKSILNHLALLSVSILASGCIPMPMHPAMMGASRPGPTNHYNADDFAKKLVTLEVGKTTTDQAISILGKPSMRNNAAGSMEMLMYFMVTKGQAMPVPANLIFRNGVLVSKNVVKEESKDGTMELNQVYKKGL